MERIVIDNDIFYLREYQLEKDFERDVVRNYRHIFGHNTIYIDIKKKIGDSIVTIPDGYFWILHLPTIHAFTSLKTN